MTKTRKTKPEADTNLPSQNDLEDLVELVHSISETWLIDHGRKKRPRRKAKR